MSKKRVKKPIPRLDQSLIDHANECLRQGRIRLGMAANIALALGDIYGYSLISGSLRVLGEVGGNSELKIKKV